MLALFSRRRPKATPSAARPFRPCLEWLETRDCPSLLTVSVSYGTQRNITLSGGVYGPAGDNGQSPPSGGGLAGHHGQSPPSDGGLAGQTVLFTGEVNGSATTDSNGHYRVTLQAAALGDVHGVTSDGQSNPVDVTLTDTAPVIDSFVASMGENSWWTFSGHVTYGTPLGLTVNLGGEPVSLTNQNCTVDAAGNFSCQIRLNGTTTDNGMASAVVTDWWGLTSNTATWCVNQT
jgi:hypothetical protein